MDTNETTPTTVEVPYELSQLEEIVSRIEPKLSSEAKRASEVGRRIIAPLIPEEAPDHKREFAEIFLLMSRLHRAMLRSAIICARYRIAALCVDGHGNIDTRARINEQRHRMHSADGKGRRWRNYYFEVEGFFQSYLIHEDASIVEKAKQLALRARDVFAEEAEARAAYPAPEPADMREQLI